jgi:hypothetical protein
MIAQPDERNLKALPDLMPAFHTTTRENVTTNCANAGFDHIPLVFTPER